MLSLHRLPSDVPAVELAFKCRYTREIDRSYNRPASSTLVAVADTRGGGFEGFDRTPLFETNDI